MTLEMVVAHHRPIMLPAQLKCPLVLDLQATYSGYPERLWALINIFSHSCWLVEETMTLR